MYCDSDQIRQRHWATSRPGGHCLVGAVLHLSRKHCLPKAPAIALLQDAMPRPGLPLVHFNDRCCGNVAELRSIILTARRLADDYAEPRGCERRFRETGCGQHRRRGAEGAGRDDRFRPRHHQSAGGRVPDQDARTTGGVQKRRRQNWRRRPQQPPGRGKASRARARGRRRTSITSSATIITSGLRRERRARVRSRRRQLAATACQPVLHCVT